MKKRLLSIFVLGFFSTSYAQQQVILKINHLVGNRNLILSTTQYENSQRENFSVTLLQYYISNVQLIRPDGSAWVLPLDSSYFLVKASLPASQSIRLSNVPPGDYIGLRFMVGVDSLRNTMHPSQRKGCLDIGAGANGMYWSWNAGYIFFKLEGTSPQAPVNKTSGKNEFSFHVGQFGGMKVATPNNTRLVNLRFPGQPLRVRSGDNVPVMLQADLLKLFNGLHSIRIAQYPNVMLQPVASLLADNFSRMFSF